MLRGMNPRIICSAALLVFSWPLVAESLPGTTALDRSGDLGAEMVSGIDRYLDRETAAWEERRAESWALEGTSRESILNLMRRRAETGRVRLKQVLGVVDEREPVRMRLVTELQGKPESDAGEVGRGERYRIYAVAWNVFRGVEGEGLLIVPDEEPKADIIAVPDCDWSPEAAIGLVPGVPPEQQFPRRFAEAGCRVLVPALIDRGSRFAGNPGVRHVNQSQRETLWRASYEMGRHPFGYAIQKVLAGADWLQATRAGGARTNDWNATLRLISDPGRAHQELGIIGYGEGGMVAFYAGALDTRFLAVGVCGAFGLTARNAELPIYRNVWSLLQSFGDAEVGQMIVPRAFIVEHGKYPEAMHTDEGGGAPGRLWRPTIGEFEAEASRLTERIPEMAVSFLTADAESVCNWGTAQRFFRKLSSSGGIAQKLGPLPERTGELSDEAERTRRQYVQVLNDTQELMHQSPERRAEFWSRADFTSPEGFMKSSEGYRNEFKTNVVGVIPPASLPPNPRSRLLYETNGIRGYEVVLDVHPDVFAYGILVLPAGLKSGERRPVVVCQHGLEGRPTDVADPRIENPAYHQFAYRLAERGYVTFAPQNPYLGRTRFRQVLRKAQPLGLTLWSFIVRQHEAITDWLAEQPFVDPDRIGFYGLSYGGKSAMRIPVWVKRYALSICSADYNEWIWKNVSATSPYSYLWTMEYDMPEWNLGNTYNYAELSWLIFPRPFMVERGHDDGVAPDSWVAYEYARTRRFYVKMGRGDSTEIEFFDGPHSIHGVGTFEFLDRHLKGGSRQDGETGRGLSPRR